IVLDASGSFDPDSNSISFHWWIQPEAGTYTQSITIQNSDSSIATVHVPSDSDGKTFHIICEVTDNGTPNLTSYRRIIFKPSVTGTTTSVNQAPDAYAGPDQTVTISDGDSVKSVILYGSGSNDFDGSIVSYSWSENGKEICTGSITSAALPAGKHILTLKVTDNDGATSTDEVIVTVNEMLSNAADIWMEAECGTVGSLWSINSDDSASNNQYITIQSGNNSTDNPPSDDNGLVSYNFNLSESGTYRLWARVIAPGPDDDSYWMKIDNGNWYSWNNIASSSNWIWASVQSYYLNTGAHVLTIGYREDGTKLDKIYLTKTADVPSETGGEAGTCSTQTGLNLVPESRSILVYPNPVNDILNISVPYSEEMNSTLSIIDSNGKLIRDIYTSKNQNYINIAGIHPGQYFLIMDNGKKRICEKFIIK
ncbi:MAG TPA: T9SS type A sorting domain-containing protein, partial [Bacteroidales bacterium]|nr:T9SS type A sorting domain-containing protein [Bacteroidales bacterium]